VIGDVVNVAKRLTGKRRRGDLAQEATYAMVREIVEAGPWGAPDPLPGGAVTVLSCGSIRPARRLGCSRAAFARQWPPRIGYNLGWSAG
jgi:class 3 adenylate cyclase